MNNRTLAVVAAISGIMSFSTKAVFVKLAYAHGVPAIALLLLRMSFALPFYLFMIFISGKSRQPSKRYDYLFIFLAGFLGYYLASYFDFAGLKFLKASIERLILFTYPSLVIILSYLFFNRKAKTHQIVSLIISYVGIVIVFIPELHIDHGDNLFLGAFMIFLSGLCYALYIVLSGEVIPRIGATRFTSYCMAISCGLVIAHYTIQESDFYLLTNQHSMVYLYALLMAVVSTIIPSYLISFAIKNLGSGQFAIFGSLGPISTILLAYIFLEERLTWIQLLGGCTVILGVALAERRKS